MSSKSKRKNNRNQAKRARAKRAKQLRNKQSLEERAEARHLKSSEIRLPRPMRWEGESAADAGILATSARAALEPPLTEEAQAVVEALDAVAERRDAHALALVKDISRASPYADWRMLIRGLVAWYGNDLETAARCWKSLDPARRPARIALALQAAAGPTETASQPAGAPAVADVDADVAHAAACAREIRFERPGLAAAQVLRDSAREDAQDPAAQYLSEETLRWLIDFRSTYRAVEPELVRELEMAALNRAFNQPAAALYQLAKRVIKGPPHDPLNNHLSALYGYSDALDKGFVRYLNDDLPRLQLSPQLRGALRSTVLLRAAEVGQQEYVRRWSGRQVTLPSIVKAYEQSIDAYPTHRRAYQQFAEFLSDAQRQNGFDSDDSHKYRLMDRWARELPADIEPRLWLVEHLLNADRAEEAQVHAAVIQQARLDDPRVQIFPWKCAMLRAMQLARRKTGVARAEEALAEAEAQWPSWLSREWLGCLRAALALRIDDHARFERLFKEATASIDEPILRETLVYVAARQMSAPHARVKPLRDALEARDPKQLALATLAKVGAFYWDLTRTGILFQGFHSIGRKLGKELATRLVTRHPVEVPPNLGPAALWAAQNSYFNIRSRTRISAYLYDAALDDPRLAAATLTALLRSHDWIDCDRISKLITSLRESAKVEPDPFYRNLFGTLADRAEVINEQMREEDEEDDFAEEQAREFADMARKFAREFKERFGTPEEDAEVSDFPGNHPPDCDCFGCHISREIRKRR